MCQCVIWHTYTTHAGRLQPHGTFKWSLRVSIAISADVDNNCPCHSYMALQPTCTEQCHRSDAVATATYQRLLNNVAHSEQSQIPSGHMLKQLDSQTSESDLRRISLEPEAWTQGHSATSRRVRPVFSLTLIFLSQWILGFLFVSLIRNGHI